MAENKEETRYRRLEIFLNNIANRLDFAHQLRQTSPEQVENGVAGVWWSLWPELKESLSEKIGDEERNEKSFSELLDEVMNIDLKDYFDEDTPKQEKVTQCCGYINTKIQEVLAEKGLLGGRKKRPTYGLRKRAGRGPAKEKKEEK